MVANGRFEGGINFFGWTTHTWWPSPNASAGFVRQPTLQSCRAAMAIEDAAAETLDESETALLRHLLERLIKGTDPGVRELWARG